MAADKETAFDHNMFLFYPRTSASSAVLLVLVVANGNIVTLCHFAILNLCVKKGRSQSASCTRKEECIHPFIFHTAGPAEVGEERRRTKGEPGRVPTYFSSRLSSHNSAARTCKIDSPLWSESTCSLPRSGRPVQRDVRGSSGRFQNFSVPFTRQLNCLINDSTSELVTGNSHVVRPVRTLRPAASSCGGTSSHPAA